MTNNERCALVAHEVNRAYCKAIGDNSQVSWEQAADWQRESAIKGVKLALEGATSAELHAAWMQVKIEDGWCFGAIKDAVKKTHPCLVPYNELPKEQRIKDALFGAAVRATFSVLK